MSCLNNIEKIYLKKLENKSKTHFNSQKYFITKEKHAWLIV